jgi:hypothetical protein
MATLLEQLEEQPVLLLSAWVFRSGGMMISSLTAGRGLGELIALIPPVPGTGNGDWSKAEPNDENDTPPSQSRLQLQQFR